MLTISANYGLTPTFQAITPKNINPEKVIINGKPFIPLKDYKGPILKLTSEDKEKISELLDKIKDCESQMSSIRRYLCGHLNGDQRLYFEYELESFKIAIEDFQEKIRTIKEKRYKQQLSETSNNG